MKKITLLLAVGAALFSTSVAAHDTIAPGANVSVVFDQELLLAIFIVGTADKKIVIPDR